MSDGQPDAGDDDPDDVALGRRDPGWPGFDDLAATGTVYGISRDTTAHQMMAQPSEWYGHLRSDRVIDDY